MAWDPNAVLVAAAAARVSFWPTIQVPIVTCALKHHRQPQRISLQSASGAHRTCREQSGPLHISGTDRVGPAGPRWRRHRRGASDSGDHVEHLHRALELTSSRIGNAERRRLLLDSRDEPWSAAEVPQASSSSWNYRLEGEPPLRSRWLAVLHRCRFRHQAGHRDRRPALPQRLGGRSRPIVGVRIS